MSLKTPKFFYFDMGNVLLTFDHRIAARQVAEISNKTSDEVWEIIFDSGLAWQYERGELTSEEFYQEYCRKSESSPGFDELKRAASDIFQANSSIEPVLAGLKKDGRRLGILSNTCEAHWEFVSQGRFALIQDHFEIYALSFELKSMKPDAKIYTAAAEMAKCQPEEIFFVDDRPENVQAALAAGYDAVLFTTVPALSDALRQRGGLTLRDSEGIQADLKR